ncbi:hypothetical protein CDL12_16618 [Handroanthus impetiginosus]|uniref:Uncharacterized protein n=1 Tax=Handroanthus impetiginosus TaxID=429701 RepID=A0A2G9GZT9_9LAMI|nr:hypothetical protein CDL12_16618 [Handroanthus impetiginosus]
MSRCFPYPPHGYTLSRRGDEALIESIKERKEAKEQRKKEKRREKKEKRKDKKEKNKEKKEKINQNDKTCQNLSEFDAVLCHGANKFWAGTKGETLHSGSGTEPEQLERSSLTEEHGQPVCLRIPSSSSDSTGNSNKRKRQFSPVDAACGHGKILRIRLSSRGQTQSSEQQNDCSTCGRIHLPSQNKADVDGRRRRVDSCCTSEGTSSMVQGLGFRTDGERICLTSLSNETVAAAGKTQFPNLTKMQRVELQYQNLTENWAPPQLQGVSCEPEDLNWLFQGKNQFKNAQKKLISANGSMPCSSSSELFPRAKQLQEIDMYALPFTVPF